MWKIYDVTNGLGHTFCNDILTARKVLAAFQKSIEDRVPNAEIHLYGDSFWYGSPSWDRGYTFLIKEVEAWNRVPDNLLKYAE